MTRRRIVAALAALLMSAGIIAAVPAPAQAGWSGDICAVDNGADGDWRVCVQTYTEAAAGGGLLLKRVQVCAWHIAGGNSNFQASRNANFQEYTSNGTPNGYLALPDIGVGSCANVATGAYKGGPFSSGSNAFFILRGTADYRLMSDRSYAVQGPCCAGGG